MQAKELMLCVESECIKESQTWNQRQEDQRAPNRYGEPNLLNTVDGTNLEKVYGLKYLGHEKKALKTKSSKNTGLASLEQNLLHLEVWQTQGPEVLVIHPKTRHQSK